MAAAASLGSLFISIHKKFSEKAKFMLAICVKLC